MRHSVKRKLFLSLFAIAICAGVFLAARSKFPSQHIGAADRSVAPDFTLNDLSGKPFTLTSFRGKAVLLDFWATWCDPCRDEIPRFIGLQEKYRDRGLQIIGISMDDSPEPVRQFQQQFRMNYPVVMGSARIGELYGGILGLPVAFVIGPDGRIYSKHFGATETAVFEKEIKTVLATTSAQ